MSNDLQELEALLAAENSDSETEAPPTKNIHVPANSQEHTEKATGFLENIDEVNSSSKKSKFFIDYKAKSAVTTQITSSIHTGDTDSSDDEHTKYYSDRKYDDYGYDMKKKLKVPEKPSYITNDSNTFTKTTSVSKCNEVKTVKKIPPDVTTNSKNDVYTDPIFGMRISKPLVSSSVLKERMQGREAIAMYRLKRYVAHGDLSKDWVIAGAIVRKSSSKESQKGSQYCIWTLSDLKDDLKTVSIFLFRNAYKQLWKTAQGTVVGILNPSVLDKRDDSTDEACLSVDNPDRVIVLGVSKDFGFCKSRKKNGDPCTSFVNLHQCSYCIYHVKQEYQKCSKRSELQSATCGKGIFDLRNKVLGKSTVIYGGKSFSAIPAKTNKKLAARDDNRLQSLSDYFKSAEQEQLTVNKRPLTATPVRKIASQVEVSRSQRVKDLERLEFLKASEPDRTELNSSSDCPDSFMKRDKPNLDSPTLGFGLSKQSTVDLSVKFTKRHSEVAKANALKWIQRNGPLKKTDPHNVKGTSDGKKRAIDKLNTSADSNSFEEQPEKKKKVGVLSERFQEMLNASSSHADLLLQHDNTQVDKYFNKLERKEAMEEKMLNTFKVACKAVRCLKCSYTSFSASDKCKQERHPLKVFDAFKRFFKCLQCGNRTVSLDLIPLHSCKNCQSSRWQRAAMMNDRKGETTASTLSIRGEEETFLGSVANRCNINLLVPE